MIIPSRDGAGHDPGYGLESRPLVGGGPRHWSLAMMGLATGLGLAFTPWAVSTYVLVVATHALILGIASTGVNLLLGYTGLLSLGHAAFFGLGAYAGGLLYLFGNLTSFESYLLSGIVASTLLAALLGLLCARVTRISFTILTLAFTQMVHSLFVTGIVCGGSHLARGVRVALRAAPWPHARGLAHRCRLRLARRHRRGALALADRAGKVFGKR